MNELLGDLKATFGWAKDMGENALYEAVGSMFIEDIIKEQTVDWDAERVAQCVASDEHIYPYVEEEQKQGWRDRVKPYQKYSGKFNRNLLYKWFEAARPDLAEAIMRQPNGWAWLVAELDLIASDLLETR